MSSASNDATGSYERGVKLASSGDLEGAENAFRRADELGHPTAATSAGLFSESRGKLREAEDAYRRADERGDGYGAFRLGLLLSMRDDWTGAESAWERAEQRGREQSAVALHERLRGPGEKRELPVGRDIHRSAFANPVLVGAVTVLVLMVAVFLAYNANAGLPFVPTKEIRVDLADGSNLVVGNDVREGGFQVGIVSSLRPVVLASGQVGAQATLKLSEADGAVPVDSTASVLPKSVLGLKYVALTVGSSHRTFGDGATIPISQTSVPVQFDDIFKTFDQPTRDAIQRNLAGYGDVFAGRGGDLNDTVHSLPSLFGYLRPVARYLSAPGTELTRFFSSLNAFMGTVSPVAEVNARLFTDMATTFAAISRSPQDLEETIRLSPSTLDVSTASLRVQQPFLVDLTTFGKFMQPATLSLKQALPSLVPAVQEGTRALRLTPSLNSKLQGVMSGLKSLALAPGTNVGLNALAATVQTLNPMVKYLGPYQTVCDYWNYWWTFLSEHLSEQTNVGFAQRALLNFADASQPNNVGAQGATAPANGQNGGPEFFHSQNYGAAIDNHGNADCETGQRGYPHKLNYFDPQHRNLATDQHTPGDQGPTYHGRTHVPKGETYSRNPTTGPQTLYNPTNP